MSMSVQSSSNDEMVKPLITRKSRQFQTAGERWSTLKQSSSRSFDRLNIRNRFEEDRLLRKHRHISDISDAQLKEVFRVKDEMRVTLVDIAKSKRHYNSSESEFESRLRSGRQSPVFQMEYRRLKRKQLELDKLGEQLKGPNSKLLASNLTTELKHVEMKALREATRKESKFKEKWLAPLKAMKAMQTPASDGAITETAKPPVNDFASLVKMVHKQFKEASISGQGDSQDMTDTSKRPDVDSTDGTNTLIESLRAPEEDSSRPKSERGQYPISRPQKTLIPIETQSTSLPAISAASVSAANVEVKRKKRPRKDTKELSLPTVPELSESPLPPILPVSPKPKLKKIKAQKTRNLPKKGVPKTSTVEISRTESARRRDRSMQKRLSDLAAKTKEDIANRRSMSPNEALNSIHQAEVVARLQLARSKVGIHLPELHHGKTKATRTNAEKNAVSLPPLNVQGPLLRELKEQRRKHKYQSSALPKLP